MHQSLFLLVVLFTIAKADLWEDAKGVTSDVGNFFEGSFNDFKDLFASDQEALKKQIKNVKGLLKVIQTKSSQLKEKAGVKQKEVIDKVSNWAKEVSQFGSKVERDGDAKFSQNRETWEQKVKSMFEDQKLSILVPLVNSDPSLAASFVGIVGALLVHIYVIH